MGSFSWVQSFWVHLCSQRQEPSQFSLWPHPTDLAQVLKSLHSSHSPSACNLGSSASLVSIFVILAEPHIQLCPAHTLGSLLFFLGLWKSSLTLKVELSPFLPLPLLDFSLYISYCIFFSSACWVGPKLHKGQFCVISLCLFRAWFLLVRYPVLMVPSFYLSDPRGCFLCHWWVGILIESYPRTSGLFSLNLVSLGDFSVPEGFMWTGEWSPTQLLAIQARTPSTPIFKSPPSFLLSDSWIPLLSSPPVWWEKLSSCVKTTAAPSNPLCCSVALSRMSVSPFPFI